MIYSRTNIDVILIKFNYALSIIEKNIKASRMLDFPMSFLPTKAVKFSKLTIVSPR